MKRFDDMTDEELVNLSEQGIRDLVALEIAEEGIEVHPEPVEPSPPHIGRNVEAWRVGNLYYLTLEAAEKAASIMAYLSCTDWRAGWEFPYLKPFRPEITKEMFYDEKDIKERFIELEAYQKEKDKYRDRLEKYKEYRIDRRRIELRIRTAIAKAKERMWELEMAKKCFEGYFLLTRGDIIAAE